MKYAKMLGLLAVAAAAMMAFVGTASATTLTSPAGTTVTAGTTIEASSTHTKLDGTVVVTCEESVVSGPVEVAGSGTQTVEGNIASLTFKKCGSATVQVLKPGRLIVHTDHLSPTVADGNGTLTSTGAEITVLTHNILGTVHCIYETEGTHIGTLKGSINNGGATATLEIGSAPISRISTDFGCGSTAEWTGDYSVTKPMYLDVD